SRERFTIHQRFDRNLVGHLHHERARLPDRERHFQGRRAPTIASAPVADNTPERALCVRVGEGVFPFKGEVIWLTREQGGRADGPPSSDRDYAQLAHVPPGDPVSSASFVLRGFNSSSLRSTAEARWLVSGPTVRPGTVISVTEGPQLVAFFVV